MLYYFWRELGRYLFVFSPFFISIILVVNAFTSNGGLPQLLLLQSKLNVYEQKLFILTKDADYLEHKVNLIKGPVIDMDLLEELAHTNLGFSYSNELLIPTKNLFN